MRVVQYTKNQRPLDEAPDSPCISLCMLEQNNECRGCHRTSAEITYWSTFSDAEKRAVIARCAQRAAAKAEAP